MSALTINAGLDLIEAEVLRSVQNLPLARQVNIMRAIAAEHSWSYGSDKIDAGCDMLLADMADAEREAYPDPYFEQPFGMPTLTPITTRARQLDPAIWGDLGDDA